MEARHCGDTEVIQFKCVPTSCQLWACYQYHYRSTLTVKCLRPFNVKRSVSPHQLIRYKYACHNRYQYHTREIDVKPDKTNVTNTMQHCAGCRSVVRMSSIIELGFLLSVELGNDDDHHHD